MVILVAGTAFHRDKTVPMGSTADLHGVRMTVIALAWIVSFRVTIHASRMVQYGGDRFKSSAGPCLSRSIELECPDQQHKGMLPHKSAARTRSGGNGSSRRRAPVQSKITLPIVAARRCGRRTRLPTCISYGSLHHANNSIILEMPQPKIDRIRFRQRCA